MRVRTDSRGAAARASTAGSIIGRNGMIGDLRVHSVLTALL